MYVAENTGLWKGNLKSTWQQLQGPIKIGIVAVAVVLGLVFVLRILPLLVAAMGIGLLVAILFVPYWIPTIVAFFSKHPSKAGIFALNLFFGWTFVGWVVSLVWALSSSQGQQQMVVVNTTVVAGNSPSPHSQAQVGDVVDGRRFNGVSWVPIPGQVPPAASLASPQYRVGDVVNGHRFDGSGWVPVDQGTIAAQPPPPRLPSA